MTMTMTIDSACKTGNLDWLKAQKAAGTLGEVTVSGNRSVQLAAANGHLDIVKWLVLESELAVDVTAKDNMAIRVAATNGHLDIIKWLVKDYGDWVTAKKLEDPSFTGQAVDVTTDGNCAVRFAAYTGHLNVVRWLVEESGQAVDVTAMDNWAVKHAAANEYLDTVRWLVEMSNQSVDCRDCMMWKVDFRRFESWPAESQRYLRLVGKLQDVLGLEDWKTGLEHQLSNKCLQNHRQKPKI